MQSSSLQSLRLVVLISGRGSNLQAIIDAIARGEVPAVISAVISDRAQAGGLELAARAGIAHHCVERTAYPDRAAFEAALISAIEHHQPQLIVLAGFMRVLSAAFVHRYEGRLINIHPSLLPALAGLDTHRRAIEAGLTEHGASVHFVTPEVDGGPVVLRARVPVKPADDAASLAERVLAIEHRIYPLAIRWYAEHRVRYQNGTVIFDGQRLDAPIDYADTPATQAMP
jgi:phosphoribosylglycinamide formyltransferase-1